MAPRGVRIVLAALLAGLYGHAAAATERPARMALEQSLLGRTQLHGLALRGLPYSPVAETGAAVSHGPIAMRAWKTVRLDGDGETNVRGNLYPIDADGDGTMELLHFNGERLMQVLRQDGSTLWRIENPDGKVHRSNVHRDTVAVFDADGDGRQEVVHCWKTGKGRAKLVLRDGLTGEIERTADLDGPRPACQIAGFRFAGEQRPRLFVAHAARQGDGCFRNYLENYSRTVIFDAELNRIGDGATCDAGHYAWPLDENEDGEVEAVFVGKYLLERDGSIRCTLPGWGTDHVDSLAVADIDAARPGHEVVASGRTGVRFYSTRGCRPIWELPPSVLQDPQWLVLARLDRDEASPSILVHGKGRTGDGTVMLDANGIIRKIFPDSVIKSYVVQNADLDGARGADEVVGTFGRVWDNAGRLRLDTGWYWNQQPGSQGRLPVYDQWAYAPLVHDVDGDGEDEMVVWGRDRLIIGKRD